jgi:hypothetical protein
MENVFNVDIKIRRKVNQAVEKVTAGIMYRWVEK